MIASPKELVPPPALPVLSPALVVLPVAPHLTIPATVPAVPTRVRQAEITVMTLQITSLPHIVIPD